MHGSGNTDEILKININIIHWFLCLCSSLALFNIIYLENIVCRSNNAVIALLAYFLLVNVSILAVTVVDAFTYIEHFSQIYLV